MFILGSAELSAAGEQNTGNPRIRYTTLDPFFFEAGDANLVLHLNLQGGASSQSYLSCESLIRSLVWEDPRFDVSV